MEVPMSFVLVGVEQLAAAAADASTIEATLTRANGAAALPTTQLFVAAGDEVSAAIAELFGDYGRAYQRASAGLAQANIRFARLLSTAQTSYASTEAASVSSLQALS